MADAAVPHVLFIDDEEEILDAAQSLLERLGYRATCFAAPEAALAAFAAAPESFGVVVTDYAMPGQTGDSLIRAMRAIRPGLPAVMLSGFGDNLPESALAETGPLVIVQKPTPMDRIRTAIQQALAGTGS